MSVPSQKVDCCRVFAESYDLSSEPAMREIERNVLGCDYGGTSWTTSAQAAGIGSSLGLRPGVHLLEIGAGSGWPGLYLADVSGCEVTLLDLPMNALAMAERRAVADGIDDRVTLVSASGDALPFAAGSIAAISHSDVLCCLPAKQKMLEECRRVAAAGAKMHFSVISIAAGLDDAAKREAEQAGPPYVGGPKPYADLLAAAGWRIDEHRNVTPDYLESLRALVGGLNASEALATILGSVAIDESIRHREAQIDAVERGLLVREIFLVVAA